MLSGSEIALLDGALIAKALRAFEEQLHALAAAQTANCIGITCQIVLLLDDRFTGLASPFVPDENQGSGARGQGSVCPDPHPLTPSPLLTLFSASAACIHCVESASRRESIAPQCQTRLAHALPIRAPNPGRSPAHPRCVPHDRGPGWPHSTLPAAPRTACLCAIRESPAIPNSSTTERCRSGR